MTGTYEFGCLLVIEDESWWEQWGHLVEANWEAMRVHRYSSRDTEGLANLAKDPRWSNEGLFASSSYPNDRTLGGLMDGTWETGNANDVGKDRRGWIVGHFIDDPPGIRTSNDVEIKWAHHPAGEERMSWVTDEDRTTIIFLVSGRFWIELPEKNVLLANEGDYLMWRAGTDHLWRAEEDSVVVIVRWPSIEA